MNQSESFEALINETEHVLKKRLAPQGTSNTYRTYRLHCVSFIRWVAENYGCATLTAARSHVTPWLQSRTKLSKNTRMVDASALAKLYDEDRRCFCWIRPISKAPALACCASSACRPGWSVMSCSSEKELPGAF